jgi:long-chain fatty acid transport protein
MVTTFSGERMESLVRRRLLGSVSLIGIVVCTTTAAQAGGFAVREQSTYGQGASFAGIAAGGAPSAMYWNPATMTQTFGLTTESSVSLLVPDVQNYPALGTSLLALGQSGNIGDSAVVPSSYAIYQAMPNVWLGLSINAPFGLSLSMQPNWAGHPYARNTEAKTYNFAPSVAVRLNEMISIGFGVQVQYIDVDFNSGLPPPVPALLNNVNLSGDGFGYGFTAGITFTPTPTTTIGLGWRSAINQNLEGDMTVPAAPLLPFASTPGPIEATVNLPDMVSLGIRQRIGPAFTLLGTVEWTNWSRIGTTLIERPGGAPALVNGVAVRLPFEYEDGWFYSIGAEYNLLPTLTLRAGLGFEQSPITDRERTPRIPDADRTWVSVGASYQVTPKLSFDLAYTHVFVDDANINISAASGNPWFSGATYIGTAESKLDIFSFAVRYRWFDPPAAPLITKG